MWRKDGVWHGELWRKEGVGYEDLWRKDGVWHGVCKGKNGKKYPIANIHKTYTMETTVDIRELQERIERESSFVDALSMGMNQVIVGQKHLIESLLIGLLSDGHILLEGVPGLAKTLAIKTMSELIKARFSRIQFTPDLLPADVIGTQIY